MKKLIAPEALPASVKRDIEQYISENNLRGVKVEHLTEYEALDYYLKWNGIINWTEQLLVATKGINAAAQAAQQQT